VWFKSGKVKEEEKYNHTWGQGRIMCSDQ